MRLEGEAVEAQEAKAGHSTGEIPTSAERPTTYGHGTSRPVLNPALAYSAGQAQLRQWLAQRRIKTRYIEPRIPWQNGCVESFNGSLRDECLNRELMLSVAEARVLIEDYRRHYNDEKPHGGIGYRTPAQARLEALASSRPPGSLRPELEPSPLNP